MEYWILALPILLIFLLVVTLVLFCFRKWKLALGVLIVSCAVNRYGEVLALHPFGQMRGSEGGDRLSVMTFNIHGPGDDFNKRIDGIAELIEKENPDVVFVSEIFTPYKHYDEQMDSVLKVRYPYSTFEHKTQWGNAFYSKYPIDTVEVMGITIGKCLPLATVSVNGRKLSLLGCHLSSNNYVDPQTKLEVDDIATRGEARQYLETLEKGYRSRRQDVDSLAVQLSDVDKSHLIVLGDMNDIGGSYTIRGLESLGLSDAWWKGGFGMGGTRKVLRFPFRIDHILVGRGYQVKSAKVVETGELSDHDAVMVSLVIE